MEGLIDNAKKFMASEQGQKMQETFEQKGGADVDQFLSQTKSSGDNVNFSNSTTGEPSYGAGSDTANQYSVQRQNQDMLNADEGGANKSGGRGDTGVVGDVGAANVRERDHDYSGYGGEDSTAEGGWGANKGGDSFSRQNQLGADRPESGESGQGQGRTDYNDSNYDGGRQGATFDASGTSTPAYRQEDEEYEGGDKGKSGKTQGGGSYGLNPYGDNSTQLDNPLHEQHH